METVKQLAQTYLGPLSDTGQPEQWQDLRPPLPSGVVTGTVNAGIDPSSNRSFQEAMDADLDIHNLS